MNKPATKPTTNRIEAASLLIGKRLQCSRDKSIFTYTETIHEQQTIPSFNHYIGCSSCKREFDPIEDVFFSKESIPKNRSTIDHYFLVLNDKTTSFNNKSEDELLSIISDNLKNVYRALEVLSDSYPDFTAEDIKEPNTKKTMNIIDFITNFNYHEEAYENNLAEFKDRARRIFNFIRWPELEVRDFLIMRFRSGKMNSNFVSYDDLLYEFPDKDRLDKVLRDLIDREQIDVSRSNNTDRYQNLYLDRYAYFSPNRI